MTTPYTIAPRSGRSTPFTVPAVATQIIILVQPSANVTAGFVFAQQPVVQIRNAQDVPIFQTGVTITVSIASGPGILGGTLSAMTDASGIASFTNLSMTGSGTSTLRFSGTGMAAAISTGVAIAGGTLDPLLQRFVNGDFKTFEVYQGSFPHPSTDTRLITTSISSASIVSATQVQLSFGTPTALVQASSGSSQPKYISISTGALNTSYSTAFPTTENPLSEGGHWLNGGTNGIDFSDFRVTSGFAYGTQLLAEADSTSVLTGNFSPNQFAQATVKIARTPVYNTPELELRLRTSITAHSITGYECTFALAGAASVARWNGPIHSYNAFTPTFTHAFNPLQTGDVLRAEITGNIISLFVNGTLVLQVDVSSLGGTVYLGGGPGIGWNGDASVDLAAYGFSQFSAGQAEAFYMSLGLSTDDFNPQVLINDMNWVSNDAVNLSGFPVTVVAENIAHYSVIPSNLAPGDSFAFTVDGQTQDAGNFALHRIGRILTPTLTTISGGGGGSIAEGQIITNRYGAYETMHATAGAGGSVQRVNVVDQDGFTGASANINVTNIDALLTFTVAAAAHSNSVTGSYTRTGVVIAAGHHMLVRTTGPGSTGGNVPTAPGLAFTRIATHDFSAEGAAVLSIYVAPCPSGFNGTVTFSGNVQGTASPFDEIMDVATSVPVTNLTAIAANTSIVDLWTGSAPALIEITYAQAFADPHHAGVALFLEFSGFTSTPRAGWTESGEVMNAAATVDVTFQHRNSPDTKASALYTSAAAFVVGLAIELAGVPT